MIHFLHIPKTGGIAIRYSIKKHENNIKTYPAHLTKLIDIPKGDKVFFVLRDPVKAFVSAFYSRFREGKPTYYAKHTETEKISFKYFKTANSLAEALTSNYEHIKNIATMSMLTIRHVNRHYSFWFESIEYLLKRKDDILHILFNETLDEDFKNLNNKLKILLNYKNDLTLPGEDNKFRHKTPNIYDTSLSLKAEKNIRDWYYDDILFYEYCLKNKNKFNNS